MPTISGLFDEPIGKITRTLPLCSICQERRPREERRRRVTMHCPERNICRHTADVPIKCVDGKETRIGAGIRLGKGCSLFF